MQLVNIFDYEKAAAETLPRMALDYYAGGSGDEVTVTANRQAFEQMFLAYKVLVDVSNVDCRTEAAGTALPFPLLVAPMAFQKMAHPDGELAVVRACGAAGVPMILSTLSTCSIEEVLASAGGPVWFQLYIYKDRSVTESLVARAEASGCQALVVTVDAPYLSCRERDVRNRFHLPDGLSAANFPDPGLSQLPDTGSGSSLFAYFANLHDAAVTWDELSWLRSITKLPILLKGIIRPDDALRAVDAGVDAIVVSNHGGRQLDGAVPAITALPAISRAVRGRVDLLVDGGIRRGVDLVKAIACGAKAVLIGRPILWGLAVNGEAGVAAVLRLFYDELKLSMALCGCPKVDDIKPDLIWSPDKS